MEATAYKPDEHRDVIAEYEAFLKEPRFDEAGRVHDWRDYVDRNIRRLWGVLDFSARLCIYLMAEEKANAEEWD